MRVLVINLKRLFISAWSIIMFLFCMVMEVYYFVGICGGNVGIFVNNSSYNFNIFLQCLVSIVSIFAIHSIKEAEYGLLRRQKLFIAKYLSVVIFSLSSMLVPAVLVVIGGVINSISPVVLANLFAGYLISSIAQVIFMAAVGVGVACLIKNKAAYIVSLAAGFVFSPFIQLYIRRHTAGIYESNVNLLNLFNTVYDEPFRIRYSAYGAPFNGETILSWIITLLAAAVIILLVLLLKRCYKLKGNVIASAVAVCSVVLIAPLTFLYFNNCPVSAAYDVQSELDPRVESGEIPPELGDPPTQVMPSKIDFLNVYDDETSPLVRSYKMELRTGNTVKNKCVIGVDPNGNDNVKFKLDECFEIEELLVNGAAANYDRNCCELVIKDIANNEEATISVKYSGRMNYVDGLDNKTDFCDISGGYLSSFFAWYPKLLSSKNMDAEKEFEITVDACNSFVTNLDSFSLHKKGRNTITGKKKDVLLYIGYISSLELDGRTVILPTEFKNNKKSLVSLSETMNYMENGDTPIYTRNGYFAVFDWDVTGLSDEEIYGLLDEWILGQFADVEQVMNVDTVIISPITYNAVGMTYLDGNVIFKNERGFLTRSF